MRRWEGEYVKAGESISMTMTMTMHACMRNIIGRNNWEKEGGREKLEKGKVLLIMSGSGMRIQGPVDLPFPLLSPHP